VVPVATRAVPFVDDSRLLLATATSMTSDPLALLSGRGR
jgi:hypothetical protein